jgi:hypothetical protein
MTRLGAVAIVAVFGAMVGCSGSGSGGAAGAGGGAVGAAGAAGGNSSGSGVDGNKLVSALTSDDKAKICDWFASLVGGYGKSNACGMGSFQPPLSQSDCMLQFSICDAKVSDYEACSKANEEAQQTCTDAAFGAAVGSDACTAVRAAGC